MDTGSSERKNIILASSIVILINLAGGNFKDGVTPFGAIHLEEPEFLGYFIWFYFSFAVFRYWQSIGSPSFTRLSQEYSYKIDQRMTEDIKYKKLIENLINKLSLPPGVQAATAPLIRRGIFSRYIDFRRYLNRPNQAIPNDDKLPIVKIRLISIAPMELRSHMHITFFKQYWFNEIFPWAYALFAITTIFFK